MKQWSGDTLWCHSSGVVLLDFWVNLSQLWSSLNRLWYLAPRAKWTHTSLSLLQWGYKNTAKLGFLCGCWGSNLGPQCWLLTHRIISPTPGWTYNYKVTNYTFFQFLPFNWHKLTDLCSNSVFIFLYLLFLMKEVSSK